VGPDNGPFAGRHYRLAETLCVQAPVHQPRPPIMIGGTGEKKTILGGGDPIGDPDGFLRSMEGYAKLGVDLVGVIPVTSDPVGFVAQLGETIAPRLAQIPAT
jgi:alkanesulfonate monooxygenase SsuD/methylene tetrahydromethanopterin reductase-like flavin-dependent oxidoreductase (luciferase family)